MLIRAMACSDARAIASLGAELGYHATETQVEERFAYLPPTTDAAFVATEGEAVTGWIHVHVVQTLTSERRAEILGLVVADAFRRSGVGRALVAYAEAWARDRGLSAVRVRCSTSRTGAHEFYRALGYRSSKRQEVFDKTPL